MARKSRTPRSSLDGDGVIGDMLLWLDVGMAISKTGELFAVSSMVKEI